LLEFLLEFAVEDEELEFFRLEDGALLGFVVLLDVESVLEEVF